MKRLELNKLKILIPVCAFLSLNKAISAIGMTDIPAIIRIRSFYSWESLNDIYSSIIRTMEFFLLIVPTINFYKKDFSTIVTYCITRNRRRSKWYFKKVFGVVCLSVVSTIIYSCTSLAVLIISKTLSISQIIDLIRPELYMDVLLCLYLVFFQLFLNTLSLLLKQSWILPIGVMTSIITAFDLYRVQQTENGIILNPMANMFFPLHTECYGLLGYDDSYVIHNFTFISSVIYFLILITLLVLLGYKIFRSLDLGLVKEE